MTINPSKRQKSRTTTRILFIAILLIGTSTALGFQQKPTQQSQGDQWLASMQARFHLPGVSAVVLQNGKLTFSGHAGFADLEQQVPVTENTLFRCGSLSKLWTIAIAARLVEKGDLAWQQTVADFLPAFPQKNHSPTLSQLAAHTGGVRHYHAEDFGDSVRVHTAISKDQLMYANLEEGLVIFKKDPLIGEPGTRYQYSSYGYNLFGVVLEKAAGKPFDVLLKEEVTSPLKLESAKIDHPYRLIPHRADTYNLSKTGQARPSGPADNSYKWPSGGLICSAVDMARLGTAFLEPGFFRRETLQQIFQPQPLASTKSYSVGLGWRVQENAKGQTEYHHGGAIEGGRAFILLNPETRTVVVLQANAFASFGLKEARELAGLFQKP